MPSRTKGWSRSAWTTIPISWGFHDRGILVDGGIIFGFDTDTPDVFDRTIEALKRVKIDSVAVNILIPYPGTEFYRKLEMEGRIICTDYSKYTGGTVIVRPKNMTVEQLQAGYNRFTKDYYRMMEIVAHSSSRMP